MKSSGKMHVGNAPCEREASLARDLERERRESARLRAELSAHDDEMAVLKKRVKMVEQRSMEEMEEKMGRIRLLNSELEARAETIAHLTLQLHHFRLRSKQKQQGRQGQGKSIARDHELGVGTSSSESLTRSVSSPTPISMFDMPRPPSVPRQKSQTISRASTPKCHSTSQKRQLPTSPVTDLVVISEQIPVLSCPSSHDQTPHARAVRRGRLSQSQILPNAEDFLHTTCVQPVQFTAKEPPAVLPPIGVRDGKSRRKVHIKHLNSEREDVGSDVSQIIKDRSVGSNGSGTWQKVTSKHPGSTD